jgi:hypothetical protein
MKFVQVLCAVWICTRALESGAAESPAHGRESAAPANADQAAGRTVPSQAEVSAQPPGTRDREPTQARARTGGGSNGRDTAAAGSPRRGSVTPPRSVAAGGVGQAVHGNSARLQSLLSAKAPGLLARHPGRPAGSTRAVTHGQGERGSQAVGAAGQRNLAASNTAAPPTALPGQPKLAAPKSPASPAAAPRSSGIGGPHAQVSGRIGGPAVGRATRSATIDGGQLRHKF